MVLKILYEMKTKEKLFKEAYELDTPLNLLKASKTFYSNYRKHEKLISMRILKRAVLNVEEIK